MGRHRHKHRQVQVLVLVGGESDSWAEAAQLEASERRLVLRAAVHKAAAAVAQRELSISLGTECALFQLVLLKEPGRHVRIGSHRLHFFSNILLNGWVRRGCFLELGKFGHVKVVSIVCQRLLTGIIWDLRIPRGRCVRHQEKEQMLTIV